MLLTYLLTYLPVKTTVFLEFSLDFHFLTFHKNAFALEM